MIFMPNLVCVLTNERYKTYRKKITFCHLGHATRVGLWMLGVKTLVRGFAMARHRLCILVFYFRCIVTVNGLLLFLSVL